MEKAGTNEHEDAAPIGQARRGLPDDAVTAVTDRIKYPSGVVTVVTAEQVPELEPTSSTYSMPRMSSCLM